MANLRELVSRCEAHLERERALACNGLRLTPPPPSSSPHVDVENCYANLPEQTRRASRAEVQSDVPEEMRWRTRMAGRRGRGRGRREGGGREGGRQGRGEGSE